MSHVYKDENKKIIQFYENKINWTMQIRIFIIALLLMRRIIAALIKSLKCFQHKISITSKMENQKYQRNARLKRQRERCLLTDKHQQTIITNFYPIPDNVEKLFKEN